MSQEPKAGERMWRTPQEWGQVWREALSPGAEGELALVVLVRRSLSLADRRECWIATRSERVAEALSMELEVFLSAEKMGSMASRWSHQEDSRDARSQAEARASLLAAGAGVGVAVSEGEGDASGLARALKALAPEGWAIGPWDLGEMWGGSFFDPETAEGFRALKELWLVERACAPGQGGGGPRRL